MTKYKNIILIGTMAIMLFGLSVWSWTKDVDEYSDSERRTLATFPELTLESISQGKFMDEFENYAADQFPQRESFRSIKAFANFKLLAHKDDDGLYMEQGHIGKADSPSVNYPMLDHAISRFNVINNMYIKDTDAKVYFCIIPDKNHYVSQQSNILTYKHEDVASYMEKNLPFAQFIDITEDLTLDDYYRTDTHWKQENLAMVVNKLMNVMDIKLVSPYNPVTLDKPFYGVYVGQLALPVEPDIIHYLESPMFEDCIVTNYETGMPSESYIYDMEKANGKDPYEIFLSGTTPLMTIENPNATTDKELVVFRDSFASSLMPLLVDGYKKITLVDIRYIASEMLGMFVQITDQDVLFLYSSTLLNSSSGLK